MRNQRIHASTPRTGVSLLEVLFSIGVIVIGLFGVVTLVPLAGHQAKEGLIADASSAMARQAIREFDVRSMKNPNLWMELVNANPPIVPLIGNSGILPSRSYCIDPRFVARNVTVSPQVAGLFPYTDPNDNTIVRMQRLTLRQAPTLAAGAMGAFQADRIFQGRNDLSFALPNDKTLPPEQVFGQTITQRQFKGGLSWFATLVPRLDRNASNPYNTFNLSVVVMEKRDPAFEMDDENERVVQIRLNPPGEFFSGGITGGDAIIRPRPGRTEDDLELDTGQWVMLSARYLAPPPANSIVVHKWYRVLSTDKEIDFDNNGPLRHVTFFGPDFDVANVLPAAPVVQVTIMEGVIGVYEKTIRLEQSSLWTN